MLSSCASSDYYSDYHEYIPDQPANVRNAGDIVTIPDKALTKTETADLLIKLRNSELKNARAVNTCKAYHKQIQRLHNRRKQQSTSLVPDASLPPQGSPTEAVPIRAAPWWLDLA